MKNSALKMLAQKAKKRLSTAGQNYSKNISEKTTKAYLSWSTYKVVASKQKIEEDPLFDKVKKIMEKGDITNPLSELTDQNYFNTLNSADKEKYILDISKRYNTIKEYFSPQES